MTAIEFTERYQKLAPKQKEMEDAGWSYQGYQNLSESHFLRLKQTYYDYGNEIVNLVKNYDMTGFAIGPISLTNNQFQIEDEKALYFGEVEVDPLILRTDNGFIEMRSRDNVKTVDFSCASSCEGFLDALIVCEEYFTSCLVNPGFDKDIEAAKAYAFKAGSLAGGKDFMTFYSFLLVLE